MNEYRMPEPLPAIEPGYEPEYVLTHKPSLDALIQAARSVLVFADDTKIFSRVPLEAIEDIQRALEPFQGAAR